MVLLKWCLGKLMVLLFVFKSMDFVDRQNCDRNIVTVVICIIVLTRSFLHCSLIQVSYSYIHSDTNTR